MLAANIGVLGGIIFLAYEIRQNTTQLRSDASYSITEAVNSMNADEYLSPEFADLLNRGKRDFGSLTDVERARFEKFHFSRLNLAEYILVLEAEGLSDLQFEYIDYTIRDIARNPGSREWFMSIEATYVGSETIKTRLLSAINNQSR